MFVFSFPPTQRHFRERPANFRIHTQVPFTMAQTDRKALVALYNTTAWLNNRNWGTSAALSQWYGVEEVNTQGRVVKLALNFNNLQGILLQYPSCMSLTFPKNSLTDSGPFIKLQVYNMPQHCLFRTFPRSAHGLRLSAPCM